MSLRRVRFTLIAGLLSIGLLAHGQDAKEGASANTEASPALGSHGMVSSAHPIATRAGLDVLADGGNAFDAAVAVASTLTVVEPYNSSIGGYGHTLLYDAESGRTRAINGSGRIPIGVDSDVFRQPAPDYRENRRGAKAISTPGLVAAWEALWKQYGTKPWADLFNSAISVAEQGYPIARPVGRAFQGFSGYTKGIYGRGGEALQAGDLLIQHDLAESYRLIATEGAGAVYGGALGKAIIASVAEADGFLAMEDLLKHRAEWVDTISIRYRDYEVVNSAPPANSFTSLMRLGMMSNFDNKKLGHNTAQYLHRFAEVTKNAYWQRLRYAGDPEIKAPPLEMLLSPAYLEKQVAKIDPGKATPFVAPGIDAKEGKETTHFVVADRWGNIVSATQTLGGGYGSRVMAEGTGIWLNNSLYFCTFEPKGNPMDAHPGRRKLASFHPTFVMKEGRVWIAIGTPGGHTIGQTVAQVIMNVVDFGMDIQSAIAAPRIAFATPDNLSVEAGVEESVREALEALGHNVRSGRIGNANGLTVEYDAEGRPARFTGGADPRGRGQAHGL